ncbi:MAG TPA: hypothetical protein DCE78_01935 [Bacteroidetes bacterium]|nr:hypothetical protein [Bacteroidota bacterium]
MELTINNFKRIYRLNWIISGPVLFMFAWPYFILSRILDQHIYYSMLGCFLFAIPFTLTILHGHISVAIGPLHRNNFYKWQQNKKGITKLAFHPVLFSTKIRLILIMLSLILLLV